jgi:hypothetical protein
VAAANSIAITEAEEPGTINPDILPIGKIYKHNTAKSPPKKAP